MTKLHEEYKCEICGNIVEIIHGGVGEIVCCDQSMKLIESKREDLGKEKHVPVLTKQASNVKVNVGSIDHPMEEKHYIEWIEIVKTDGVLRKYLSPGQSPSAEFEVTDEKFIIRAYCNVHGLWTS